MNTSLSKKQTKAQTLVEQGRIREAYAEYAFLLNETTLEDQEKANILLEQGIISYRLGKILPAQKKILDALTLFKSTKRENVPFEGRAQIYLACIKTGQGALEEGLLSGRQALSRIEKELPENSEQIAEAAFLLSLTEYRLKHYAEAEKLIRRCIAIWKKQPQSRNFALSTCMNNLGRIYEEQGFLQQAIVYHKECLAIRQGTLGIHPETAFSLGNLGTAFAQAEAWPEAVETLTACIKMYQRLGETKGLIEGYQDNLALCRQAMQATYGAAP